MVLDAAEDMIDNEVEDGEDGIPILNRHLAHRNELESRIPSKEEILKQRQEMLEEEMMKENEKSNLAKEVEIGLSEEELNFFMEVLE